MAPLQILKNVEADTEHWVNQPSANQEVHEMVESVCEYCRKLCEYWDCEKSKTVHMWLND